MACTDLTSTLLNTFGLNADCKPCLFVQQHYLTSQMPFWVIMAQVPTDILQHLVQSLLRRVEAAKGDQPMVLEWVVQQAQIRCDGQLTTNVWPNVVQIRKNLKICKNLH